MTVGDTGAQPEFRPSDARAAGPAPSAGTSAARREAVERLLLQAIRMVDLGRPMPLSTSVIVNREELLAVLHQARAGLPEEMRAARWLLKERDDMRARMKREGEEIIATARARAERMVQRTEVVKEAERRARRTLGQAEDRSVRMRLETEDWCDQRLAAFEALLHKTLNAVSSGRQRMQDAGLPRKPQSSGPVTAHENVFDQDSG